MKFNLDDMQSMLGRAWDDVINYYIDHIMHMEPTTQDEMMALRDSFKERFGKEGDRQVAAMAASHELNGGKQANEDPEGFYPGMEYSLPASLYFMRKALDEERGKYKHFCKDVENMFEKNGAECGPIPSKSFMKELVKPHLEILYAAEAEASADHEDVQDSKPSEDEQDHGGMAP